MDTPICSATDISEPKLTPNELLVGKFDNREIPIITGIHKYNLNKYNKTFGDKL